MAAVGCQSSVERLTEHRTAGIEPLVQLGIGFLAETALALVLSLAVFAAPINRRTMIERAGNVTRIVNMDYGQ